MSGTRALSTSPLVLSLLWLPWAIGAQPRAPALVRAQLERESLQTGVLEIVCRRTGEDFPPVVYTARYAEQGDVLIHRGDETGTFYCSDGSVSTLGRPHVVLKTGRQTWWHDSDGVEAMLQEPESNPENIWRVRALGMGVGEPYDDLYDTLWWDRSENPEARTYEETIEDGLHVVRAHTSYGTIIWWVDSQRGWNPVRIAFERDGHIKRESRVTLRQFDGHWYPGTVVYYAGCRDEGGKPVQIIEVRSAEFNRPNHPRVFTPADIGVDAGVLVTVRRDADPDTPDDVMHWDGKKLVTQEEFSKRAGAGELKRGPNNLRALDRLEAEAFIRQLAPGGLLGGSDASESSARQRRESQWEAYTRAFVSKYRLDDAQSQRAYAILRDCQEQANRHLLRRRAAIEEVQAEARNVLTLEDADKRAAAMTGLRLRHSKLVRPVLAIFDEQLKPRLDKLPTRAQRKAAGESTARANVPQK